MSVRAVVVAHRDRLAADGIAAGLDARPEIAVVAATVSASEAVAASEHVDAVAIDELLPGALQAADLIRRRGVRVVVIGEPNADEHADLRVPSSAGLDRLATALVPQLASRRPLPLTVRQERILSLVAAGMTARQVARQLGISPKTVEQHKTRIFVKLGVPNQAAAVGAVLAAGRTRMPA
jgi:DNA-binding NarL/FixJ family response regulator